MTRIGINKKYIATHTFQDLKKINLGTKVKKNFIISLEEIIKFIPPQRTIIANIIPSNKNINIFIDKINKITQDNKNIDWLITSMYKDILDKLVNIDNKNFKIGKFIIEDFDWNFSFDFYIVNKNNLKREYIIEKLNTNQIVFINNIDKKCEADYIRKEFKNINIISNNSNKILY